MTKRKLVELHCHTNYSDGIPSVEKVIKKAESCIDAIAITDHNTYEGYEEAKKLKKDVLLIPGVEVHASFKGKAAHATVLGCEDIKFEKYMNIFELIDNAHSAGGIVINVHPFGGLFRPGFTEDGIVKKFDAVEVLNGMTFDSFNNKALHLAKRLKMKMVSGSDAHTLRLVGKYACEIRTGKDDIDGLIKAIKSGRVVLPKKKTGPAHIFASQVSRKIYTKMKLNKQ